jgi:hypothetical protein
MSSNFNIFSHRIGDSLHLQLFGSFDGSSAFELINTLRDHSADFFQIFVDTNDLKIIDPFGRKVFQKNLRTMSKQADNIIFIGKHKHNLEPQRNNLGVYF